MSDWQKGLVGPETTISEAISIMTRNSLQILLIVESQSRLIGTVTDGDIRRGYLRSVSFEHPVSEIMRRSPKLASPGEDRNRLLNIMRANAIRHLPLVDGDGSVVGLMTLEDLVGAPKRLENWVVLMAGGLGNRLRPLTDDLPKPLLKVGDKPILETILETFIEYNFRRFYLSVNYKADKVKEYFGDGSRWGIEIRYLEEQEKLGTAGPLGLIDERPALPLVVMNGDVLTKVNLDNLLRYHSEHGGAATMCVREYDFEIPFGVVETDKHRIVSIKEKPVQRMLVNAGIYVVEPSVLDHIPKNGHLDMPALFARLIEAEQQTAVFPIREYWLDIGRMDDFQRANWEFDRMFGQSSLKE
jgi:dTDP-glucose pyrophosphorylase